MTLPGVSDIFWNNLLSLNKFQWFDPVKGAHWHMWAKHMEQISRRLLLPCLCHSVYIFLFMTLLKATLNVSWLSK